MAAPTRFTGKVEHVTLQKPMGNALGSSVTWWHRSHRIPGCGTRACAPGTGASREGEGAGQGGRRRKEQGRQRARRDKNVLVNEWYWSKGGPVGRSRAEPPPPFSTPEQIRNASEIRHEKVLIKENTRGFL